MLRELRASLRTLRASPLFTAVAVATIALGIGSNAAIFAVVNAVLLRPLPFPASERLVAVYSRYLPSTGYDFPFFALSGPEFLDLHNRVNAFSEIAAYDLAFQNITLPSGGDVERVLTMRVTAGFFDVLGVKPQRGRAFTEDETRQRSTCVAVLGHDVDKGASGSAAAAVGTTIRLDDAPCTVVGIMPEGFGFRDSRVRVWTALAIDTDESPQNRASHPLLAIARLRENVSQAHANSELESLRRHWSEEYPDHYAKGHFAVIRPLQEDLAAGQRQALMILGGAVLFVLMIVCVNLSALLVSRTEARRREFAIRYALGAHRHRLIRQLLGEATVLAFAGGVIGILVANWLLFAFLTLYPQRLPVWQAIAIDHYAIACSLALTLIIGVLVGIVPALNATGRRLHDTLKADTRSASASRRSVVARSSLVVAQLALSVVLLTGALLLIRSYQHLQKVDLGLDPDNLLTFELSVPEGRQPDTAAARRNLLSVENRVAQVPGAAAVGAISDLPLASAGPPDDFIIEGRATPAPGAPAWNARYVMTTPRVFSALRIPLKRGRLFTDGDAPGAPLVALVNETATRLYWPDQDPVGQTIRYYPRETSPPIRIIGVVGDVRSLGRHAPAPPAVYVPYAQAPRPSYEGRTMSFVIRADGDASQLVAAIRAKVAEIDPALALADVQPMSAVVATAGGQARFTTIVVTFFACSAFLLAALGLYGTVAYAVEQRMPEIGIRIALGANSPEIYRLVLGSGMRLAAVGILLGVPAALAVTRLGVGFLYGITSSDVFTYIAVVLMLAFSSSMASYIPARRAMRIDVVRSLRQE
jgi:putative ABC transport system permease protein